MQSAGVIRPGSVPEADYLALQERERRAQSELLTLSAQNMELRFQAERAGQLEKEAARLRDRAADLDKYVEFLKAERQQQPVNASIDADQSAASTSSTGNVKRVWSCRMPVMSHSSLFPFRTVQQ